MMRFHRRKRSVPDDAGQCFMCMNPKATTINGVHFCADHVEDGIRFTIIGQSTEAGVPTDEQTQNNITAFVMRAMVEFLEGRGR